MPNTITPNMSLILPTPGQEPGPQYATDQNQSMTIIDGHNHGPGSGVPVTPSGLNINTNLNFLNNSPYNVKSVIFSAPATNSGLTTLYTAPQSGGGITDLFYNDGVGNVIALTKAGQVNATIASIPGESYSGGTFTWKQGAGSTTPANFDIGSIVIRPNTPATTNGVILGPPSAISSQYNVQLPIVPASNSFLQLNTDGSMVASIPISQGLAPSNFTPATQNQLAQPGDIKMSGAATATGWLICDGTSYLRATWPALFTAIGTAYGSADGTHFNVPDMRGMFPRGTDPIGTNDPDNTTRTAQNTGGNTGANVGSQQGWQIQSHTHSVPFDSGGGAAETLFSGQNIAGFTTVGATGGNQTNPINVYVNFFIKT